MSTNAGGRFVSRKSRSQRKQEGIGQPASTFGDKLHKKQKRSVAIARSREVPEHIVGKAYKDLTPDEWYEVKKHRVGHNLCKNCGLGKHEFIKCKRVKERIRIRKLMGLCLDCGSPAHKHEDCPDQKQLIKDIGCIAKSDDVPNRLIGVAYSVMDKDEKAAVKRWRRNLSRCIMCGTQHNGTACPRRVSRISRDILRKKREIASGKKILNLECTGTYMRLPVEIRMRIWLHATKKHRDVVVFPGYIPVLLRTSGVPFSEIFEAFLRANVFFFGSDEALPRFQRLLKLYNGFLHVRAVHLPSSDTALCDFTQIATFCPRICKLRLSVTNEEIGSWTDYNTGIYNDPSERLPEWVTRHRIKILCDFQQLKGVNFTGKRAKYSWSRDGGGFNKALEILVDQVKDVFVACGRTDVHIGCSLKEDVDSIHDEVWENLGLDGEFEY